MPFYLTFSEEYFNYSITTGSWELLIINLVNYGFADSVFDNIKDYVDAGGHLLMSSYVVSSGPHPLWATLGFTYASNFPNNDPFYIWDDTHSIFNHPFDYDASLFQPFLFYADDGDLLTVYDNATTLAGYTISETDDNAVIVLRNDKRTLYNGFIIDELSGDNNFNGFEDRIELWTNEIAFMWAQIIVDGPIEDGIPEYIIYIIIIGAVVLIGLISIIVLRKRRKNK
jgi:hypothetical protein